MNVDKQEEKIALKLIEHGLATGWSVSVYDGEEYAVKHATSVNQVVNALGHTEMESLTFHEPDYTVVGTITLVWGNGEDLIHDSTDNAAMEGLCALAI